MKDLIYRDLLEVAIAEGATSPNPGGRTWAWSTTTNSPIFWNGSVWRSAIRRDANQTFTAAQRGAIVTLTDGATITPDFALSNFFELTIGGNRTLANPSNVVAGQSGCIFITQDGTGSRTITTYGSQWKFPGGTAPVLSTAANAVDRLDYVVRSSTHIHASLAKDIR